MGRWVGGWVTAVAEARGIGAWIGGLAGESACSTGRGRETWGGGGLCECGGVVGWGEFPFDLSHQQELHAPTPSIRLPSSSPVPKITYAIIHSGAGGQGRLGLPGASL